MNLNRIVLTDELGRSPGKGGSNHSSAESHQRLDAHHPYTVDHFIARQIGPVTNGQNGYFMTPRRQSFCDLGSMRC
jgi:hypothetical protein